MLCVRNRASLDLIPHAEGIALTELDSVPGGVGLTAHLEIIYDLVENPEMVVNFGHSLADAASQFGGKANMVIAVSEEAATLARDEVDLPAVSCLGIFHRDL